MFCTFRWIIQRPGPNRRMTGRRGNSLEEGKTVGVLDGARGPDQRVYDLYQGAIRVDTLPEERFLVVSDSAHRPVS